jgi:glutathione S-transferase
MFGAYSAGGLGTALHVGVPYVAGEQFSVADITLLVTIGFAAKAIDLALPGEHLALRRWYDRVSRRSSTSAGAASTAVIRPMAFRPLKRLTASRR